MEDINKDIEILENLLEEGFEAMCYPEAQAIEHLIQAYKELEEENMQLETIKDEAIRRYNFESIPVSLVKDKIEELNKLIIETQKELGSASKEYTIYVYQKNILQGLLERSREDV